MQNIWCDAESDEGLQRLSILDNKEWAEEWAEGKWKTKLDNDKRKSAEPGLPHDLALLKTRDNILSSIQAVGQMHCLGLDGITRL